ncbi:hypothetical protein GPL21_07065 [Bradyrhizobium pachyrhizi]|uniref:Uncharacterized protein n=1 Tax=Bradyrhizobium pachyrhizi TaxID=280333 RepID=A0A844SH23_9BRAD|nr:hypothetical protein [Bradyrhizobium pachyrhizi]MVT64866.1 hypothetical protein [Bradyrhizobium pachyrhizi]
MLVTICRLYDACSDAGRVIILLRMAGVPAAEISIVANDSDGWYRSSRLTPTSPKFTAARGPNDGRNQDAAAGAAIRATATGAGISITMLTLPDIGVVVGVGWLAARLESIAVRGLAGRLLRVLIGSGIAEDDAPVIAEGVRRGAALVAVRVQFELAPHLETLMDHWAVDLKERCALYRETGWLSFDPNARAYTADQVRCERILHACSAGAAIAFQQPRREGAAYEL